MMNQPQDPIEASPEGSLDIREFLGKVARRRRLVLAVAALFTALVAVYSYSRPSVYLSTAQVLVRPILVAPLEPDPLDNVSMSTEVQLVSSTPVAELAGEAIGSPLGPPELLRHVSVTSPENTQIFVVSFSAPDPEGARRGAQAFAKAYLTFKSEQADLAIRGYSDRYQDQIAELDTQIAGLETELETLEPDSAEEADVLSRRSALENAKLAFQSQLADVSTLSTDPGEVIQAAALPSSPVSPNHELDLALGLFLGLAAGVTLASAREQLRDRIQSPFVLRRCLKAPTLGVIPRAYLLSGATTRLVSIDEPRGAAAEAYRTLRTNLLAVCRDARAKTILVTSAHPGEGKTTTAVNLAVALAQVGRSVVLISADLRYPRLHTFFGDPNNEQGLGQVLRGTLSLADALVETRVEGLRVLPSGPVTGIDDPVELLQSDNMVDVIRRCRDADFVIVDSPPMSPVADSLVLADLLEGVLFVADAREGTRAAVLQSRHQLEQVGGRVLGGVLNRVHGSWSSNGEGPYDHRRGRLYRFRYPETDEQLVSVVEAERAPQAPSSTW